MNFYNLNLKEESLVKKNAANFFLMEKYADSYLKINKLRLNNFREYNEVHNKKSTIDNNTLKVKYGLVFGISCLLVYKFKSILIVPFFLVNYSVVEKYINYKKEACYFCQKTTENYEKKKLYNLYFKCINKVFERNENIKSLDDFEKELDKMLKDLKI